jgi:hypothetical protein
MDEADDARREDRLGFRGDPAELYDIDASLADEVAGTAPVMIVALDGYVDAGSGVEVAVKSLRANPDRATVVTFDADGLIDYRSRRPGLTFAGNSFTAYDTPHLIIERLRDAVGVPYLLFTGPEPDLSWEKFCAAVRQVIDRLGVRLVVTLMAIPMGVPHTRPTGMSVHATRPEILPETQNWIGSIEVPGHVSGLLEYRLGESGHDAVGFAVHVPHYLAQSEFADAALRGLNSVIAATGLDIPTEDLAATAGLNRAEIAQEVAGSEEVTRVVEALERQYDHYIEGREKPSLLATDVSELPSADEIGAEFEQFLRERTDES